MAGTISLSLSQQFDRYGNILAGGRLYFIRAGTVSTPQNAYYDADLTLPFPNPYTLDASGRIPQFFLADGSIKVRLIDSHGVEQLEADNLLVVGPSGGGGGGGSVDPTTVVQTGQLSLWYGTGVQSGFVRCNARTIGSATSGATERANSDTQALFLFLWAADANLSVSTGRGVSAAADWAANKTIALPDLRGRTIYGLDDMGNTAAGRLSATYFGTAATSLGDAGGSQSKVLVTANLPPYTPAGAVTPLLNSASSVSNVGIGSGVTDNAFGGGGTSVARITALTTLTPTASFAGTAQGGISTPVAIASPGVCMTIYIKL